jgi:hypothetical protein
VTLIHDNNTTGVLFKDKTLTEQMAIDLFDVAILNSLFERYKRFEVTFHHVAPVAVPDCTDQSDLNSLYCFDRKLFAIDLGTEWAYQIVFVDSCWTIRYNSFVPEMIATILDGPNLQ